MYVCLGIHTIMSVSMSSVVLSSHIFCGRRPILGLDSCPETGVIKVLKEMFPQLHITVPFQALLNSKDTLELMSHLLSSS